MKSYSDIFEDLKQQFIEIADPSTAVGWVPGGDRGCFTLRGGTTATRAQFEAVATKAAAALNAAGYINYGKPLDCWLDHLKKFGYGFREAPQGETGPVGGSIENVVMQSALACLDLQWVAYRGLQERTGSNAVSTAKYTREKGAAQEPKQQLPHEILAGLPRDGMVNNETAIRRTEIPTSKGRGRKRTIDHDAIAAVVRPHGPDWQQQSNLEKIADELKAKNVPPKNAWAKLKPAARSWPRALDHYRTRVVAALQYSLKMANRN